MADNFVNYDNAETLMTGIGDRIDRVTWTGTAAEWAAEQHKEDYDLICITDDGGSGIVVDQSVIQNSVNPVAGGAVYTELAGKTNKPSSATEGNFASFDANKNPVDSGKKASDFLTQHQDISGKADKPSTATTGNFASFDANKNPIDSGKKASDFVAASAVGTAAAKNVPTSGNASSTEVVMGNDTRLTNSRTPTAHNHSAADINSSSTLGAQVKANATSVQTLGTSQLRNIYAGTSDMTAGTSALTTGDIYVVYE